MIAKLPSHAPAPVASPPLRPRPAPSRPTVLVAEDDYTLRWTLCEILRIGGFQVLDGADGVEAWDLVERHPGKIDVLVSDIMMPRMDGMALAARMKHLDAEAKVLLITGFDVDRIPTGCQLLHKPFTPKQLLQRVQQLLAVAA